MSTTPIARRSMVDERPVGSHDSPTAPHESDATSAATRAPRKKHWGIRLFGIFIMLPVLLIIAWALIALNFTYSRGERAGYIQKFSQKGWVCKTWEGELAMVNVPGAAQERFPFSVRNDSVAQAISRLMGSRVAITYEQHKGIPGSCFAETEYFVTRVQPVPTP